MGSCRLVNVKNFKAKVAKIEGQYTITEKDENISSEKVK